MNSLCLNGGYFNVELGTGQAGERGEIETKFDYNCLRVYGGVTPNDISVRADIQGNEWIKIDVRLRPKDRAVDLSVNGRVLSTICLRGLQWSCITAVLLKGWAKNTTSWYDSIVIEKLADASQSHAPVPVELVLEEEALRQAGASAAQAAQGMGRASMRVGGSPVRRQEAAASGGGSPAPSVTRLIRAFDSL